MTLLRKLKRVREPFLLPPWNRPCDDSRRRRQTCRNPRFEALPQLIGVFSSVENRQQIRHSNLSVSIGLTRVARRAGARQATIAVLPSTKTAATIVMESLDPT
jgi:hypothetical protein